MKRNLVMMAFVVVSGCATPTPGSTGIIVTGNTDQVRGCQLIKQVMGSQVFIGGNFGREDVVQQFRNEAVAAGATHVLTLDVTQDRGFTASGRGELYRCK
jgi:hypothetical protein